MEEQKKELKRFQAIFNIAVDFFGIESFIKYFLKVDKYARKHFNRFSAILLAITTIGIWIIRSFGYSYQSGKLSIYNIDKSYVCIDNNFFLQVIEFIAVGIFYCVINFIYFHVATKNEKCKFFKISFMYICEMLFVLSIAVLKTNYGINGFISELSGYSFGTWIFLIILLFIIILSFNSLGIQMVHFQKKREKNKNQNSYKKTKKSKEQNSIFSLIISVIIFLSFVLIICYIWGMFEEKQRTTFKIIQEQTEDPLTDSNVFKLQDNDTYRLYAVVYENMDIYILCQLNKSENGISINTNYQKIVSKENLETNTVNDIYKIKYIN